MTHTMKPWQRWVFYKSRDPAWLWGALIVTLLLGVVGGLIAERFSERDASVTPDGFLALPWGFDELEGLDAGDDESAGSTWALTQLRRLLDVKPLEVPGVFDELAAFGPLLAEGDRAEAAGAVAAADTTPAVRELAQWVLEAVWHPEHDPPAELVARAEAEPPVPLANYALGVCWDARVEPAKALAAFEREGLRADATEARERVILLARQIRDADTLTRLADDPAYAEQFNAITRLETAIAQRDWWDIVSLLVPSQYEQAGWRQVGLAAFAGLVWWLLFVQLSQPSSVWSVRVLLCVLAFVLGAVSTMVTLLAIIIEEDLYGFVERTDMLGGLIYMIAGVGLREEVSKLLLFLPLVPILLKRGNQLEMLIVAGCVGLGFAAEENVNYFHGAAGPMSAPGRFLTANFLHVAMTGLIGLSFCRVFIYRQIGLALFAQTFVGVVVLHGLYNALISVPDFGELSFATFFCIAALAFWFFREMRELRPTRRDVLSPVATFVVGLALMLSVTLVVMSADIGVRWSAQMLVLTSAELALVAYLFLREMPGSLVTV